MCSSFECNGAAGNAVNTIRKGQPMQQKKNPLLIVLAVCGGCALLAIIVGVILSVTVMRKGKGLFTGFAGMTQNMPAFMIDLQSKNYTGAAALIDPSARSTFSADKIQQMEEAVEKKLGPLQSFRPTPALVSNDSQTEVGGSAPVLVYVYQYTLVYQKGVARANLTFKLHNNAQDGGLVSDFTLAPDERAQGQQIR